LAIGQEIGRLKLFARGGEDIGVIAAIFLLGNKIQHFNLIIYHTTIIAQFFN
jgi:hypothetical protein